MLSDNDLISHRKKDGFSGQKAITLPSKVIATCNTLEPVSSLFMTDIGFYPRAKYHYRERKYGSSQSILIYCSDGEGWIETEKGKLTVKKDQFLIIPAGSPHIYGSLEQDPWSIYWLHFCGNLSAHFDSLLTFKYTRICGSLTYSEERLKLFQRMYNTLETGYSFENLSCSNMCLWHFLSSFCYPDIFLLPQQQENKDLTETAIDFMLENLHRPLQLHELAAHIHISVSYFSALFKKKTGYSPVEYFNHIKIQKACQYLQFTDMHIKVVGRKLGFDDPYYFSRLFNNLMGIPPAEYRIKKRCRNIYNTQPDLLTTNFIKHI